MKTIIKEIIDINLSSSYEYIIGFNILENIQKHIGVRPEQAVLIITDEKVWGLYGDKINNSFFYGPNRVEKFVLKEGEDQKNLQNFYAILEYLADKNFGQSDLILAIGGGVVGDISGLAAALYMRGMNHVYVATTTLAAVDSSVGGKTAVNLSQGKNLVGAFKQPKRVLCDIDAFDSLSDRNFYEGMVEALKMGFITDEKLIPLFKCDLRKNKDCLIEIIKRSVLAKYRIVEKDEYDKAIRQILNFGHTIGHAIEQASAYELRHGEAVAKGMVYMTSLSEKKGLLSDKLPRVIEEVFGKKTPLSILREILSSFNIDLEINYTYDQLEKYILMDKKQRQNSINLIMLESIGKATIKNVSIDKLQEYLNYEYKS